MKNAFEYEAELTALREEIERLKAESFESLYNAAIDERDAALKLTKPDFSLIGIVRVPPMEYDEP